MLALTLVSRTVIAIVVFFVLSAIILAVLVTTSSAIIAAAIVPTLVLLSLVMDNDSAIRLVVSTILWRRHSGARSWRRLIPIKVIVMVVVRRGPGVPPLSLAGAGRDRDRVLFLMPLPPAQL